MAVTWYTQSGQPSDATGADGDMSFDYAGRIQWGPRGLKTAGSWVGTAVNAVGPTGPGVLSGTGSPGSSLGNNGNAYVDAASGNIFLKSSNAWSQTGTLPSGPVGPTGYSALTTQAVSAGPATNVPTTTLSSTPATIAVPGGTLPLVFVPSQSSAFMGIGLVNNSAAVTLALVDTTSNTTIYSTSIAANTSFYPSFPATQYPMVAGHVYQWQMSGSGSAQFQFTPFYLMPSASTAPSIAMSSGFNTAPATAFSSTATYGLYGTNASSAVCKSYTPSRAGAIYGYTAVYTPSTTGAAAATVTATLNSYNFSSKSGSVLGTFTINNTGVPVTTVLSSTIPIAYNTCVFIGYTGSGTGQVNVDLFVVV